MHPSLYIALGDAILPYKVTVYAMQGMQQTVHMLVIIGRYGIVNKHGYLYTNIIEDSTVSL